MVESNSFDLYTIRRQDEIITLQLRILIRDVGSNGKNRAAIKTIIISV